MAQIGMRRIMMAMIAAAIATMWPHPVAARGHHSRDPVEQAERQHHRSEEVRLKHRKDMDLRGAEIRDAKKSSADSKQSEMQTELGPVNDQTGRWGAF